MSASVQLTMLKLKCNEIYRYKLVLRYLLCVEMNVGRRVRRERIKVAKQAITKK